MEFWVVCKRDLVGFYVGYKLNSFSCERGLVKTVSTVCVGFGILRDIHVNKQVYVYNFLLHIHPYPYVYLCVDIHIETYI